MIYTTKDVLQIVAAILFTTKPSSDDIWEPWSEWGPCSVTCGEGVMTRIRRCNDPPPADGGEYCKGPGVETRPCLGNCGNPPAKSPVAIKDIKNIIHGLQPKTTQSIAEVLKPLNLSLIANISKPNISIEDIKNIVNGTGKRVVLEDFLQ